MKACLSLFAFLALVSCILAYPHGQLDIPLIATVADLAHYEAHAQVLPQDSVVALSERNLQRTRRQLNIQGGGSSGKGIDLNIQGRAPVWQSTNGRHSLDATGQYSQHLGGPYGNSKPNFGAGAVYTFRF